MLDTSNAEIAMPSQAKGDMWRALGEMANLLTHLNAIPPHERATAARAPLLRYCVAIRGSFMDDPDHMRTLVKDAQKTMQDLRNLRAAHADTSGCHKGYERHG